MYTGCQAATVERAFLTRGSRDHSLTLVFMQDVREFSAGRQCCGVAKHCGLDALDLQKRSWVPYSGWPIPREELEPFYDRPDDRVRQLGPRISYQGLCAGFGLQDPGFDQARLYMECSQWSPKPNFGKTYRQELTSASDISVLLHANVTSVVSNDSAAAVQKIEFRTLTGKQRTAKAHVYVICCGGIETARLLLASDLRNRKASQTTTIGWAASFRSTSIWSGPSIGMD
jgi:hypothetical protein